MNARGWPSWSLGSSPANRARWTAFRRSGHGHHQNLLVVTTVDRRVRSGSSACSVAGQPRWSGKDNARPVNKRTGRNEARWHTSQ